MLSTDNYTKALAALATLKDLVNRNAGLSLADKIMLNSTYKDITNALEEGKISTVPEVTVTEQVQPETLYDDEMVDAGKLTRKEQTDKISKALEMIARGRAALSSFIKHDDKTVVSINSPANYNQAVVNTLNNEQETLRLIFSTNSFPYFVTYSPKTKYFAVTSSRYYKTLEALEKAKTKE